MILTVLEGTSAPSYFWEVNLAPAKFHWVLPDSIPRPDSRYLWLESPCCLAARWRSQVGGPEQNSRRPWFYVSPTYPLCRQHVVSPISNAATVKPGGVFSCGSPRHVVPWHLSLWITPNEPVARRKAQIVTPFCVGLNYLTRISAALGTVEKHGPPCIWGF